MAAQTIVTLAAGVSTALVAAREHRRYLKWMVIGANPMTVAMGAGPAVAGQGMNYDPSSISTANQGGAEAFEGNLIAPSAFTAISTGGTTVCVWED